MAFIELNNVSYTYIEGDEPPVTALRNIDLSVEKGEMIAIIGPNGSGKSTLAKLFNGLFQPTEGSVSVGGLDTSDSGKIWDIRQQVGMVFQNPDNQLIATMVEEEVAFGPENLGLPSATIKARVDEALALVGLEEYRQAAPHHLSGGQKQRVAIAGIFAMRPDCIVFDEPTAMLDPMGRKEVMATIQKLRSEGKTIIYITHFMEEIVDCDRVIILKEGEKILEGTPLEAFQARDLIKDADLELPEVPYLVYKLREAGLPLSDEILTPESLVKKLCLLN